jgi:hypothetical protein
MGSDEEDDLTTFLFGLGTAETEDNDSLVLAEEGNAGADNDDDEHEAILREPLPPPFDEWRVSPGKLAPARSTGGPETDDDQAEVFEEEGKSVLVLQLAVFAVLAPIAVAVVVPDAVIVVRERTAARFFLVQRSLIGSLLRR